MNDVRFPIAEKFAAPQGEGVYTGQMMKFIRLVGCSVGKDVCHACDTEFSKMYPDLGGGLFSVSELVRWVGDYEHVCLSGGEPLDRDLRHLLFALADHGCTTHIETSGTVRPGWLMKDDVDEWRVASFTVGNDPHPFAGHLWVTVSPKPKYLEWMIGAADELKVILGGLGDGPGWPSIDQAVQWARQGKLVYVQPRNETLTINGEHMNDALKVIWDHPELRLSTQLHKYIRTR